LIVDDTSNSSRFLTVIIGQRQQFAQAIKKITDIAVNNALLVTNSAEMFETSDIVTFKQATGLLGQEKRFVIIDLFDELAVDALAALAGIVPGSGGLIFCMPPRSQWQTVYASLFAQRFIHYLDNHSFAGYIDCANTQALQNLVSAPLLVQTAAEMRPTADQTEVIEAINRLSASALQQTLVIVSDRGRGKSSSLGMAAAALLAQTKITILITAPRFKACEVAFIHAQRLLGAGKIKQACLRHRQSMLRFMAPDEILQNNEAADIVLIDEAAAIPLPLLQGILERYAKTVFVSTVHGYEGTGRGFSVRFMAQLQRQQRHWKKIEMKTPVRWAANDRLEAWLFKLLCLDAELPSLAQAMDLSKLTICQPDQQQLADNEALLSQVFALLVLAHYRTRPSDLQRLLDDELTITVAQYDNRVVAVLLSCDEGAFEASLSSAIYQGRRRIKGHLLAQTLTYHCGVESAASARSHRIMRVVVQPDYQSMGIGSQLVQYLSATLKNRRVDVLGSSFGLTDQLARFWQANGFELVRIGLKHEKSSGERAAVLVQALTPLGADIVAQARQRFAVHLPLLRKTLLSDVDAGYESQSSLAADQLSPLEWQDIESFIDYSRAYELCIGGVNKWLTLNRDAIKQCQDKTAYLTVIEQIALRHQSWQDTTKTMGLAGKQQTQDLFKEAVLWYWQQLNP